MLHPTQQKILDLSEKQDITKIGYRKLGELVGVNHPQLVKHHLNQLIQKGFIKIDKSLNVLSQMKISDENQVHFINIPIVGKANCGQATMIADERIESFLKISPSLLDKRKNIFALEAKGDSMNRASVNGKFINDGDYVIVDSDYKTPKAGDYVVSIIEGCANIKKLFMDKENNQIVLLSESTNNYPPIFIDANVNFLINGKVIQVIKKVIA